MLDNDGRTAMQDITGVLDKWNYRTQDAETIASLLATGWKHVGTTTHRGCLEELTFFRSAAKVSVEFRYLLQEEKPTRNLGNRFADEGLDRCVCGSKYWEKDRCVDCNTHVLVHRARFVAGN